MLDIPRTSSRWFQLADQVLDGRRISEEEALAILSAPPEELLEILSASYRIRHRYFGDTVQLYYLMNAKSGLCPEDCGYCSQSKVATAEIPRYRLLSDERILSGAAAAAERNSKTYCIVISARGPSEGEIAAIESVVPKIKEQFGLKICACLGLLTPSQALRLKACGVDRVNHNLNTSRDHYPEICSTHTYDDRVETLRAIRSVGLEVCSGGILGMGESHLDRVQMAFALGDAEAVSIPLNFLNPIDGTPLAGRNELKPRDCLLALAMFRFVNPASELRIAGGREIHLRSLQPLGLYPANSIFVGDYLTTTGQLPEEDYRMIEDLGFTITRGEETAIAASAKSSVGASA